MKTLIKYPNRLPESDKKFFNSFDLMEVNFYDEKIQKVVEKSKEKVTVFLVDDDPVYLIALEHYLRLELPDLYIKSFQTGEDSLNSLSESPDIVILDYFLNSEISSAENGINILKKIKDKRPDTKVIMLSCQEKIKVEMNSIEQGALEYIPKSEIAFARIKHLLMNLTGKEEFWID